MGLAVGQRNNQHVVKTKRTAFDGFQNWAAYFNVTTLLILKTQSSRFQMYSNQGQGKLSSNMLNHWLCTLEI